MPPAPATVPVVVIDMERRDTITMERTRDLASGIRFKPKEPNRVNHGNRTGGVTVENRASRGRPTDRILFLHKYQTSGQQACVQVFL